MVIQGQEMIMMEVGVVVILVVELVVLEVPIVEIVPVSVLELMMEEMVLVVEEVVLVVPEEKVEDLGPVPGFGLVVVEQATVQQLTRHFFLGLVGEAELALVIQAIMALVELVEEEEGH
jgi:hypothetical protein